jgi:hypothetical protein
MFHPTAPLASSRLTLIEGPSPATDGLALYEARACSLCGEATTLYLTPEQGYRILTGDPVHEVLPEADPSVREVIISGTHPHCWTRMFGPADED